MPFARPQAAQSCPTRLYTARAEQPWTGECGSSRTYPQPVTSSPIQMAERPLTARMVQKRDDSTITLNVYDVVDHPFHYALGKWLSCGIHHHHIPQG